VESKANISLLLSLGSCVSPFPNLWLGLVHKRYWPSSSSWALASLLRHGGYLWLARRAAERRGEGATYLQSSSEPSRGQPAGV